MTRTGLESLADGGRRVLVLPLVLALALSFAFAATARAETPTNTVTFSCTEVTFKFSGFPNKPNNVVNEIVSVDGKTVQQFKFTFNGPTGENTLKVAVPPGHHNLDGRTTWNTNGVKGSKDTPDPGGISCGVFPELSIKKVQRIQGTPKFTSEVLPLGHVGQTVEYQILVKNSGNVPLKFSNFIDPKCDKGTIEGGPGEAELAPGEVTTYTCKHVLTEADREVGFYTNEATVTGTPPEGEGSPKTKTSNQVVVELPKPENPEDTFSCSSVTFTFTGFPNVNGNKVTELIKVDGKKVYKGVFEFNGSFGQNTVSITLGPGHHKLDARSTWKTNTFKGSRDIPAKGGVSCETAEPGFAIEKQQEIEGSGKGFTTAPLTGNVGQTVDYHITVTNTGNVPLTFSGFSDPKCDEGTIAGGPSGELAPGAAATYTCRHALNGVGSYSNAASVTATPPKGDGEPITQGSNTVLANVPVEASFSLVKQQRIAPEPFTTAPIKGKTEETVDYSIAVTNTGNVPLTFSEEGFSDPNCDEGTLVGPFSGVLAPGESTTLATCSHTLTVADAEAGLAENTAFDTGTPPEGDGPPISEPSNTVITEASAGAS